MGSHRFFDHTGDFGADLEAASEAELFEASVDALIALFVAEPDSVRTLETRPIEAPGIDPEDQLVSLGNEILYLFEMGWLTRRVRIESLDEDALRATAHGEPFDTQRHEIARPVKAVTHHGARVEETEDGWIGRLIFDL